MQKIQKQTEVQISRRDVFNWPSYGPKWTYKILAFHSETSGFSCQRAAFTLGISQSIHKIP